MKSFQSVTRCGLQSWYIVTHWLVITLIGTQLDKLQSHKIWVGGPISDHAIFTDYKQSRPSQKSSPASYSLATLDFTILFTDFLQSYLQVPVVLYMW